MQDNQNNQNDNSFLLEKKDKCCGQKCGCHNQTQDSQDFKKSKRLSGFYFYSFVLSVALIIFGIIFALGSLFF